MFSIIIRQSIKMMLTIVVLIASMPMTSSADTLKAAVASDYAYLDKLFKYFHANPELSMQESETSDHLAREIEAAGFTVTRNIALTGLVGIMKNGAGPTVMIRADMDGLP